MQNSTILSRPTGSGRGYTLLELMVGLFLAGLLLTILVRVATVVYRVTHEEIERQALEEQATLILNKVAADLRSTAPAGLTLSAAKNRFTVDPITSISNQGRKIFANRLYYWSHGILPGRREECLIRSEITDHKAITDADPGQPIRLNPADLEALPLGGGRAQTNIYRGVGQFQVYSDPSLAPGQVGAVVNVTLELNLGLAQTRKTIRMERTFTLRSTGL